MSFSQAEDASLRPGAEPTVLELARRLDPDVWSSWYDEYAGFIYRYAYARLNSDEEAKDIAAQTFLEAMRSIHRYSDRGKPVLAWLYGIAHHLVSRRRRQLSRLAGSGTEALAVAQSSPEDQIALGVTLRAALEKLRQEQRDVLILRFALGMKTAEVARLLGKTEAATHSLQVRASTSLKKYLGG